MELCPFCGAAVPDLGNHYGGHRCEPCPKVADAFGPDRPQTFSSKAVLPPGAYARSDFAHECAEAGCSEPVFRNQRCWAHDRELRKKWKRNERARQAEQGRVSA